MNTQHIDNLMAKIVSKLDQGDFYQEVLDNEGIYIYVADLDSHEVIYMNEGLKKKFGDKVGGLCYEVLQGYCEECPFCRNGQLLELENTPIKYAHYNPLIEEVLICFDVYKRVNGNRIKIEIAYPIGDIIPELLHIFEKFNLSWEKTTSNL